MNSLEFVCHKVGSTVDLLRSARRNKELVYKKRAVIWFYRLAGLSVKQIGVKLDLHHTTICYSLAILTDKQKQIGEKLYNDWKNANGIIEKEKRIIKKRVPDYLHSVTKEVEYEEEV